MILGGTDIQVLVATKPVDFRKQADGLAALVQQALSADPFCGAIYVFRSPCRRQARNTGVLPARRARIASSCCGGTAPASA
jgi:transposase